MAAVAGLVYWNRMENESAEERPDLAATVEVLVSVVDRLDLGMQGLREDMRAGFGRVFGELGEVKSDVSVLKYDVHELKSDVSALKSDVRRLDEKTDRLEAKTDRIEAKLDDVAETLAESVTDHERRLVVLEARG